jgi:hypothetical protein
MTKNIGNIDRHRLQRFFVGTHTDLKPAPEVWYEMGHFIEGFELKAKRVSEKDGKLRFRTMGLGCIVEGSCEPAQNKISDYQFYLSKMNETRNVAMLCNDDELTIFRLARQPDGTYDDNRISMLTSGGYGSVMQKAYTNFSGWVMYYEKFRVKNVQLLGTNLKYDILESFYAIGVKFDNDLTIKA